MTYDSQLPGPRPGDAEKISEGEARASPLLVRHGGLNFGIGRVDRAHGREPLAHSCIAAG
jgi:hypothetical protein